MPLSSVVNIGVKVYEPAQRGGPPRGLFAWITSLFQGKVVQFQEQNKLIDDLETKLKSFNRQTRYDALTTLYGIDARAYEQMSLSSSGKEALKGRVAELKARYASKGNLIDYANSEAQQLYKIEMCQHIAQLANKARYGGKDNRVAFVARYELFSLSIKTDDSSPELETYLFEELTKAKDSVIDHEQNLLREFHLSGRRKRVEDGSEHPLDHQLQSSRRMLVSTPFSIPIFDESSPFNLVDKIASASSFDEAIRLIDRHNKEIVAGGAGEELRRVIDVLENQLNLQVKESAAKLEKSEKLLKKALPYEKIHHQLSPLQQVFAAAALIKSHYQTLDLIEKRVLQLAGQSSFAGSFDTDAIDPSQVQQIMSCSDLKELTAKADQIKANSDRLMRQFHISADFYDKAALTLREVKKPETKVLYEVSAPLKEMLERLELKRAVFDLVYQAPRNPENQISQLKAKALTTGKSNSIGLIDLYYQEALELQRNSGWFGDELQPAIAELKQSIARVQVQIDHTKYRVTYTIEETHYESADDSLQQVIRMAQAAIKELAKSHRKIAAQLRQTPLRDLSQAVQIGARVNELWKEKTELEGHLRQVEFDRKLLQQVAATRRAASLVS